MYSGGDSALSRVINQKISNESSLSNGLKYMMAACVILLLLLSVFIWLQLENVLAASIIGFILSLATIVLYLIIWVRGEDKKIVSAMESAPAN
jgi:hypothetical protein